MKYNHKFFSRHPVLKFFWIRLFMFFWFCILGIWSLFMPRLGFKIAGDYYSAEQKRVSDDIDRLHK